MSRGELAEPAIARHIVGQIRGEWQQQGYRVFLSDRGRWWATTTRRTVILGESFWQPRHTVMAPDAVDADEYGELAAKLRARTAQ